MASSVFISWAAISVPASLVGGGFERGGVDANSWCQSAHRVQSWGKKSSRIKPSSSR